LIQGSFFLSALGAMRFQIFAQPKSRCFPTGQWSFTMWLALPNGKDERDMKKMIQTSSGCPKTTSRTKEREDAEVAFCFYESPLPRQMSYELF